MSKSFPISTFAARTISSPRWQTSSNIRRGSPNRRPRCGRSPVSTQLFAAMKVGGRSRARGIAAGADQGASRSRQQDPARGGPHRRIHAEQNSAGLDRLSDAEYAAFERVNNAYRAKFGFPYIVCVRRHTRDSDPARFRARGCRTMPRPETQTSIEEICRIAALRLDQLVASDDKLPVHGRLSTHVLDTHSGRPAAGIAIELTELSELGAARVVTRAVTNSDGRTDQPLIGGRPVPIGRYELTFQRRRLFCRSRRADVGSAVSRPHSAALFGERSRRPSPRAAAGHAVELCDLSGS